MTDLFEQPTKLPTNVRILIERCWIESEEGCAYAACERLLKCFEQTGYTFDYGLDGVAYNLKLLG